MGPLALSSPTSETLRISLTRQRMTSPPSKASHDLKENWNLADFQAYLKRIHGDPEAAFMELHETLGDHSTMQEIYVQTMTARQEDLREVHRGLLLRAQSVGAEMGSHNSRAKARTAKSC